ncbi:lytic transglycosylase domain-containing protein [Longimicrobium sp.]|uniref:lytic transglycosylase domain-containing protein n=1 Tax=Longimicrobium sp. TaxID=2029185 RepID=UPI002E352513|nr:lytic transglycosylase domain-containing protein [Longimicrobium sp.]
MQALLLSVAVAQGVVTATGTGPLGDDGKPRHGVVGSAVREGVAMNLAPVVVQAPQKVAKARTEETAVALASEYRAKGYDLSDELARQIYAAAVRNEIDPHLAFGLVRTESEFKDYATSHVGAVGLTQLMVPTARWFKKGATVADLRDSETNLEIGFRYLGELIDRYEGDVELALTAYNRGTGTVDRVLKRGGDPDNGYAGKVLAGSRAAS